MTKIKQIPKSVVISAIISLTILESIALSNGIDGKLFALITAVIGGLAGFVIPSPLKFK